MVKKKEKYQNRRFKDDDDYLVGDEFDVMGKATKVHTKSAKKWVNEDFKFSDLEPTEKKIVLKSTIVLRHIVGFLDLQRHAKTTVIKTPKGYVKRPGLSQDEIDEVNEIAIKITERLVNGLQERAILSSAKGGLIIKSITDMIRKRERTETTTTGLKEELKPKEMREESLV